jgi:signal transduction histidine kinase/CheY-like chemotaxis protein
MSNANGTIGEIIKALDMAGAETLVITLTDSRIVDATQPLCRRWGCSRYDMIGKQLSQSEAAPLAARHVDEGLSGIAEPASARIEVTCRLGPAPVVTRFRPQVHRSGAERYLLLVALSGEAGDKAADEETETRLKLAVKAGGYAMWDFDLKRQSGTFAPEILAMLGLPPGDKSFSLGSWNDRAHPDDRMRTVDAWLLASSGDDGYMRHRYRIRHEAGHYLWIELIASLIKDPITHKPLKAIGLARDISEEMAAVHRIETSEQNLARSQAVAGLGSWVFDLATGSTEWSDQMYWVFDLDKALTEQDFASLFAVIQDDHLERWHAAFEAARRGRTVEPFEINITTRDGRTRRIRTHIDAEYDGLGEVRRLHGICQDITDQRLMERKFLQAQKMEAVGRLTGGIAHDFNNLLMVVMGNLQLAESAAAGDEKLTKRLHAAIEAATKGSDLTRRLLAFSRQQTLEDEEIDVNALVLGTRDMLTRAIGEEIQLDIRIGHDVWPIATDRTQLETAILNLAINARHAMPNGGTLTIETANAAISDSEVEGREEVRPGEYVLIRVTDTGHGMPPDIIDKVIQPFFTTKGPDLGSGLGLSMIYGFVTQAGGHLAIQSTVNVGTSMSIYLPRLEAARTGQPAPAERAEAASPSPPEATSAEPTPSLPPRRVVLVVEDNHQVRDVAVAMIEATGCEVLDAASGEDALAMLAARPDIELMLSDVVMPGMNGPELAAKALAMRPDLKVMFASGYTAGNLDEVPGLKRNFDLINKPFSREDLVGSVLRNLDRPAAA